MFFTRSIFLDRSSSFLLVRSEMRTPNALFIPNLIFIQIFYLFFNPNHPLVIRFDLAGSDFLPKQIQFVFRFSFFHKIFFINYFTRQMTEPLQSEWNVIFLPYRLIPKPIHSLAHTYLVFVCTSVRITLLPRICNHKVYTISYHPNSLEFNSNTALIVIK